MGHRVWLIEATVGFERNNSAMKMYVKVPQKLKSPFLKKNTSIQFPSKIFDFRI